jgi:hypothetical protein
VPLAALLELLVYLEHFFKTVDAHHAHKICTAQEVPRSLLCVRLVYIQHIVMVKIQMFSLLSHLDIHLECQHVLFQHHVRVVHLSMLLDAGPVLLDILA